MGDHASRGYTPAGASPSTWSFPVAGRGHAAGLQEIDLQGVIKYGEETWQKKRLHFHALVKLLFDYQRVTDLPVAASRREITARSIFGMERN